MIMYCVMKNRCYRLYPKRLSARRSDKTATQDSTLSQYTTESSRKGHEALHGWVIQK